MSKKDFFPPRPSANPAIYAYELEGVATHQGLIKIGYSLKIGVLVGTSLRSKLNQQLPCNYKYVPCL
jgi:hypothetical protein